MDPDPKEPPPFVPDHPTPPNFDSCPNLPAPEVRRQSALSPLGGAFDQRHPVAVGRMRAKEPVAGVRYAPEIGRAPHRIKSGLQGNPCAKLIRLQLKTLGELTRANAGPDVLRILHPGITDPGRRRQHAGQQRTGHRGLLLTRNMAQNMMRRLMAQDQRQFVLIARICDQGDGEADDRTAPVVQSLKGVRRQLDPVIHDDLEITIHTARLCPARPLGHRFQPLGNGDEIVHRGARIGARPGFGQRRHRRHLRRNAGQPCYRFTSRQKSRDKRPGNTVENRFYHVTPPHARQNSRPAPEGQPHTLAKRQSAPQSDAMFTIEHTFDATVITLVDDPAPHREDDVTINAFEEVVTLEQLNTTTDRLHRITLSMAQLRDLSAALDLPEGSYQLARHGDRDD